MKILVTSVLKNIRKWKFKNEFQFKLFETNQFEENDYEFQI